MSPSECCNMTPNTTTIRVDSIRASLAGMFSHAAVAAQPAIASMILPTGNTRSTVLNRRRSAPPHTPLSRPGSDAYRACASLSRSWPLLGDRCCQRQIIGRPTATSVATRCAGRRSIEASTTRSGIDVASTNLMGVPCDAVSFQLPQPRFAKGLARDLIKQQFCRFEVGCIEALREPLIHRREQVAGLGAPSLAEP